MSMHSSTIIPQFKLLISEVANTYEQMATDITAIFESSFKSTASFIKYGMCTYLHHESDASFDEESSFVSNNKSHYDEELTSEFESYADLQRFQQAFELLNSESVQSIRAQSLIFFIDQLVDANIIPLCSELFKMILSHRPAILTKLTVKKFFRIAIRNGYGTVCAELIAALRSRKDLKNYTDLYFRINQYFLSSVLKNGDYEQGAEIFESLKESYAYNATENSTLYYKIYEILIRACLSKQIARPEEAKTYLNEIATTKPNDVFFNKLIDFAAKNHEISFAEYVFKIMVSNGIQPSIVTYNTLIDSYFKQNRFNQAWILFDLLKKSDKKPDNFTYTTMINGLKSMETPDVEKAFILFTEYKQFNKPDQIIYNCLLDACINAKNLTKAHELLLEMKQDPQIQLDEITYNTLIKGCCRSRKLNQAIGYYEEMKSKNIRPNRITYNSLIDNCVKTNKMRDAWNFYEEMTHASILPDNFTYSILVNGIKSNHSNKDELYRALDLLNTIQANPEFKPDEILYNSLIDACIKFDEVNKGLSLYEEMKKKRIEPSSITYGILIKAFGRLNELVKAFKIFEQMKVKQMKINDVTYGCLLDACVKNDRMDLALVLVDKMKQDNIILNTILYTTLIKGFSKAGKLEEALGIFNVMKSSTKAQPNIITYNCTIDACVKGENMTKASELFEELQRVTPRLKPDLITYSTLIKGFCRQKETAKAYYYLNQMEKTGVRPDEALFNLILESCHNLNNCEMGFEIFEAMNQAKIHPSNITFSILIKLYSRARMIDKVIDVITMMRARRVRPSLITFTNIVQACFKANRPEKVMNVLQELEKEDLRWDSIFYAKLITGFLSFNRIDLATSYCEKSFNESISLSRDTYKQLHDALISSGLPQKQELTQKLSNILSNMMNDVELNLLKAGKGPSCGYTEGDNQKPSGNYKKNFFNNNDRRENKENQSINIPQFETPNRKNNNNSFNKFNNNKNFDSRNFQNNYKQQEYNHNQNQHFKSNNYNSKPFFNRNAKPNILQENYQVINTNIESSTNSSFSSGKKSLSLNNKAFFTNEATERKHVFGTNFI